MVIESICRFLEFASQRGATDEFEHLHTYDFAPSLFCLLRFDAYCVNRQTRCDCDWLAVRRALNDFGFLQRDGGA
jgi:hypothetical protein